MKEHSITSDWIDLAPDLRAWRALPEGVDAPPGILIYIEAFGVNRHMRNVAEHYARAGYAAIIPDIYHGKTVDYGDMDAVMPILKNLDEAQIMRESAQALDALSEAGVAAPPATVGFCLGGRLAFLAGLELGDRLSAAVCYYGGGIGPEKDHLGRPTLIGRAVELPVPVLFNYGGKDGSITPAEHGRIAAALSEAGKRYVMSVYPNAGHGFDCTDRDSYDADASAEAWSLTQQFLALHHG
ncbi:MAG: dienelactone hydrolase family protein [Gammaproteobacteria bacterium]